MQQALAAEPRFSLIDAPRPEGMGWSDCRSVYTFMVRDTDGWMSPSRLRSLYEALAEGPEPCQIGQPVELGTPALGGLRLAISAAHIVDAGTQSEQLSIVVSRLQGLLGYPATAT